MLPLTPQERRLLCFLAVAAGVGLLVSSLRAAAPVAESFQDNSVSSSWTAAAQAVSPVDGLPLNSATRRELMRLPGVGPVTAERIVEYRQAHGPFRSVEGLLHVKGIGPKTFARFKDRVTVGEIQKPQDTGHETQASSHKPQATGGKPQATRRLATDER